jgi:hypothetical protein
VQGWLLTGVNGLGKSFVMDILLGLSDFVHLRSLKRLREREVFAES